MQVMGKISIFILENKNGRFACLESSAGDVTPKCQFVTWQGSRRRADSRKKGEKKSPFTWGGAGKHKVLKTKLLALIVCQGRAETQEPGGWLSQISSHWKRRACIID